MKGSRSIGNNGLGMIDLEILDYDINADFQILPVCKAIVGANDLLSFSVSNQRLFFLKEYGYIQSLPILHHNTMNFLHMKERGFYKIFKQENDKFTAMNDRGELETWDMQTGELIKTHKLLPE